MCMHTHPNKPQICEEWQLNSSVCDAQIEVRLGCMSSCAYLSSGAVCAHLQVLKNLVCLQWMASQIRFGRTSWPVNLFLHSEVRPVMKGVNYQQNS